MIRFLLLLPALVFAPCVRCEAQSVANDFSTNILLDYTGNNAGPGGNYLWSPSDGVGGGGGVSAPANGDVMTYALETFDFSTIGTSVSASLDFFFDTTFAAGASNQIGRVGFAPNLGDAFSAGSTFFGGVANNPDAGNVLSWSLNGTTSNGTDGNTTFDATLVNRQWYRIALDGMVSAVDSLAYTVSVSSLGASGTGSPVMLDDVAVTNNVDLATDSTWHAGMKTRGDRGGVFLDNHRADVSLPTMATILTVDRDTGQFSLFNSDVPRTFADYTILSGAEALDATQWLSIADNYDADSGGTVDPVNIWTVTSSSFEMLAEGTTGNVTLNTGGGIDLGTPWIRGPIEDIQMSLTLMDGSTYLVPVIYEGNNGNAFAVGDLDLDGDLDPQDWGIFRGGQGADLGDLPTSLSYLQGDLDRDNDNDVRDFIDFKQAYDAANGEGAFDAMVPEPNSVWLVASGLIAALASGRRRCA